VAHEFFEKSGNTIADATFNFASRSGNVIRVAA
jgi:hypothetical protein